MNQLSVQINTSLLFRRALLCVKYCTEMRFQGHSTHLFDRNWRRAQLYAMGGAKTYRCHRWKRVCFAKSRVIQKPFYLSSRSKNKMKSRVWFFGAIFHQFSSLDEIWGIKLEIKMHFFPLKGTENISSNVNCSFSHRRSILVLVIW